MADEDRFSELAQSARNMDELRQQEYETDVILECHGGNVYAHKLLLIASCAYFKKMFLLEMKEANSGRVTFDWCSKQAMDIIVKYLYTADLPNLKTDYTLARELVDACHLMQLTKLLKNCWQQLTANHLKLGIFAELWALCANYDLLETYGIIEKFAIENIKIISEDATIRCLTENQMEKLVEVVDHKMHCEALARCVLLWKSKDVDREEAAGRLLKRIELQHLSCAYLQAFIKEQHNDNAKISAEHALYAEAVDRLGSADEVQMKLEKIRKIAFTPRTEQPILGKSNNTPFTQGIFVALNETTCSSGQCLSAQRLQALQDEMK